MQSEIDTIIRIDTLSIQMDTSSPRSMAIDHGGSHVANVRVGINESVIRKHIDQQGQKKANKRSLNLKTYDGGKPVEVI